MLVGAREGARVLGLRQCTGLVGCTSSLAHGNGRHVRARLPIEAAEPWSESVVTRVSANPKQIGVGRVGADKSREERVVPSWTGSADARLGLLTSANVCFQNIHACLPHLHRFKTGCDRAPTLSQLPLTGLLRRSRRQPLMQLMHHNTTLFVTTGCTPRVEVVRTLWGGIEQLATGARWLTIWPGTSQDPIAGRLQQQFKDFRGTVLD